MKIQNGDVDITPTQSNAISVLRTVHEEQEEIIDVEDLGFAETALVQAKKRRRTDTYIPLIHSISPTSNVVERLFSKCKLIFSDLRKSMEPAQLEICVFLQSGTKKRQHAME